MKKKRYTDEQIGLVLRQAETETPIGAVYRNMGSSDQTCYRWKKQFVGLGVAELRRLKQLEEEHGR